MHTTIVRIDIEKYEITIYIYKLALQAETSRNECPVIYLVVKKKGPNSILLKGRHYIKLLTKTNFPLKKKIIN